MAARHPATIDAWRGGDRSLRRGIFRRRRDASDSDGTISQVDPLEYISSLFCEWGPVMAYEKLLDVEVPRRAEYIRVLSGELNRISLVSLV